MRGSLRPVTFHALNSQAYTLVSRSPRPSFHRCLFPLLSPLSSSPLAVFWRSAPTTLFLIWEASPFHAGHSSPVWPIKWLVVLVSQPILCLPCPFKDCPSLTLEADVKLSAFPALLCLRWLHFAFFFFLLFFLLHKLFVSQLTFCFCLFSICLIIKNLFGLRSLKQSYPLGNWSTVSILLPSLIRHLMMMNHERSSRCVAGTIGGSLTCAFPAFHETTSNTSTRKWLLILH